MKEKTAPPPQFWGAGIRRRRTARREEPPPVWKWLSASYSFLFRLPRIGAGGFLLFTAGCGQQAAPPAPSPASAPAHWQIQMTTIPAAPQALDPAQFRVHILDSSGRPVSGATVTVNLTMPAMDMGRNQSAAAAGAAGIYTAAGRFTMPGDWQVTVQADKKAQRISRSRFQSRSSSFCEYSSFYECSEIMSEATISGGWLGTYAYKGSAAKTAAGSF